MKLVIKAGQGGSTAGIPAKSSKERAIKHDNDYDEHHVGVVGGDEDEVEEKALKKKDIKKAFTDGSDLFKSFHNTLQTEILGGGFTDLEVEFLTSELGYSNRDITKGLAVITGTDRHKFTEWLLERALSPVDELRKCL